MADVKQDIRSIFGEALGKGSPDDVARFLDDACSDNKELRAEVEELLRLNQQQDRFLGGQQSELIPTIDQPPVAEKPGTQIGPYKLREQIGEGGFGVVYVAQQSKPVRRKVALKIIKPGMDTKDVIARFEAEQQALALMDHPNIAKVLDAGATESGRPYFVMELVKGVPITEFCDERKLSTRERLLLFVDICRAIQHAHQKGIIHRDLKPSNVMVTLSDGRPMPKVIDFGISKAIGQQLTENSIYTAYGQMVGTPLYMSPEQAELSVHDVDTRSDVYSLGVLLYELLTGTTPFDKETLQKSGFEEMRRIIREVDPPRPSARISTLNAQSLSTVSDRRKVDVRKLSQSLRGELDWIVMNALEKDRSRRYESASAFAADVERYLNDEPVQACPPSVWYRFGKFARKKKIPLAFGALLAVILLTLVGSLGWMARDREIRQARTAAQVRLILDNVDRLMIERKWSQALAEAQRANAALESGEADAEMRQAVASVLADLKMIQRLEDVRLSEQQFWDSVMGFDHAQVDRNYAAVFRDCGIDIDAVSSKQFAKRFAPRSATAVHVATTLDHWAHIRHRMQRRRAIVRGDADKPKRLHNPADVTELSDLRSKRLLEIAQIVDPDLLRNRLRSIWGQQVTDEKKKELLSLARPEQLRGQPPATLLLVAQTLISVGLNEEAIAVLRDAHLRHPSDTMICYELSCYYAELIPPQWNETATYARAALTSRPDSRHLISSVGLALYYEGKFEEAIKLYQRAIELDPHMAGAHLNLGLAVLKQGKLDAAIVSIRKAIELDPSFALAHHNLGSVLRMQGKFGQAIVSHRKAVELKPNVAVFRTALGLALLENGQTAESVACYRKAIELDPEFAAAHNNLGLALERQKKFDEAIIHYRKALEFCVSAEVPRVHTNIGRAFLHKKELDKAVESFRTAIRVNPEYVLAHFELGNVLVRQNKLDDAVSSFRKAIELNEKYVMAYVNLGVVLRRQEQLDEAIACFEKVLEINPNFGGVAYFNLGIAHEKREQFEDAINAYRRAISIDRKHRVAALSLKAVHALGVALLRRRDFSHAAAAFKVSIEARTDGGGPHMNLGLAYRGLGRSGEALLAFEYGLKHNRKLFGQHPKNTVARTNYCAALLNLALELVESSASTSRDPVRAVQLAKEATALRSADARGWIVRGEAHYRNREYRECIQCLQRARKLKKNAAFGVRMWLTLAMAHRRLGETTAAERAYHSAAVLLKRSSRPPQILKDLDAEARQVLRLKAPVHRRPVEAMKPKTD